MTDPSARELLRGFVAEAWDMLAGLEQAREGLRTERAPLALEMMRLLAHRLRGSAALYGLGETSAVGGLVEAALRGAEGSPWPADDPRLHFLDDALRELQHSFAVLGRDWHEPEGWSAPVAARHARLFAPAGLMPAVAEPSLGAELWRFGRENAEVMAYFGPEAEENIEAAATALDRLRRDPGERDSLLAMFRAVHTLKGAGATVGCRPLAELAHAIEDLLVLLRDGKLRLDRGVLGALGEGIELLRSFERATAAPSAEPLDARFAEVRTMLASTRLADAADETPEHAAAGEAPEAEDEPGLAGDLAASPAEPRPATIRVPVSRVDGLMNLVGDMVLARGRIDRGLSRLLDLEQLMSDSRARLHGTVSEFRERYLNPRLRPQARDLGASGTAGAGSDEAGAAGAAPTRAEDPATGEGIDLAFEELEFDRYDDFNILARRLEELSSDFAQVEGDLGQELRLLRLEAERLEPMLRSARGGLARVRTVPLDQLFARAARSARQAAAELDKRIEIRATGGTVEIDTAIAEALADPLLHLVRNAVDHGIESEAARVEAGKPVAGRIGLRAFAAGRSIVIEVEDDGAGIDVEELKSQAVALGLRSRAQLEGLSLPQALELVYLPGLTTSATVSATSGRGVGMDVVRTNLARIGGEVEIEGAAGAGCLFRLKAPLTLAVSDVVLVRVGTEVYAIPAAAVDSLRVAPRSDLRPVPGGEHESDLVLELAGEEIDCVRVGARLGLADEGLPAEVSVVLAHVSGRRLGLVVDELLGVEEVVLKSLGAFLGDLPFFCGATFSGQGELRLLLNPPAFGPDLGRARVTSLAIDRGWVSGEPGGGAAPAPRVGARVLLVDDSISVRKVLGSHLANAGLAVTTANDGAEALERLREASFDAVVTDLEMPRTHGYELVEEIRRRPATRDLPVIVITTRVGAKHQTLARQLGISAYFAKPVDETLLIARLRAAMHRHEEQRSAAGPVAREGR